MDVTKAQIDELESLARQYVSVSKMVCTHNDSLHADRVEKRVGVVAWLVFVVVFVTGASLGLMLVSFVSVFDVVVYAPVLLVVCSVLGVGVSFAAGWLVRFVSFTPRVFLVDGTVWVPALLVSYLYDMVVQMGDRADVEVVVALRECVREADALLVLLNQVDVVGNRLHPARRRLVRLAATACVLVDVASQKAAQLDMLRPDAVELFDMAGLIDRLSAEVDTLRQVQN